MSYSTAIEDSLQRLQPNYVDIYQMHCWDHSVSVEEMLWMLHELVRCGKVHYTGASNVTGWQMQKLVSVADRMGFPSVATLQQQCNLLCGDSELEAFEMWQLEDVGVLPWSPFKGYFTAEGLLTGKFKQDCLVMDGRIGWIAQNESRCNPSPLAWSEIRDDKVWTILDGCKKVATFMVKTVSQVVLQWLLQKDVLSSIITAAPTLEQLDENMVAAGGWRLNTEEVRVGRLRDFNRSLAQPVSLTLSQN